MLRTFEVFNYKNHIQTKVLFTLNSAPVLHTKINNIWTEVSSGTNIGMALADIIFILNGNTPLYSNPNATKFKYEFEFDNQIVEYSYQRDINYYVLEETLIIGEHLIFNKKCTDKKVKPLILKGAETLSFNGMGKSLPMIRYIYRNTQLNSTDTICAIFLKFINYIKGMVFFDLVNPMNYIYSHNPINDISTILEEIVETKNVNLLEEFLNTHGYNYKLNPVFDFTNRVDVEFNSMTYSLKSILSIKLAALIILFYWNMITRIELKDCSLMIIDNFNRAFGDNNRSIRSGLSNNPQYFIIS